MPLDTLPHDLLVSILARLDTKSLARAVGMCRSFRSMELTHREALWESHLGHSQPTDKQLRGDLRTMAGVSSKAQCMLQGIRARQSPPRKLSIEEVNDEFEFWGEVDGGVEESDGSITIGSQTKFLVPMVINGDENDFSLATPVGWTGPEGNDWNCADIHLYVRNKLKNTVAVFMYTDGWVDYDRPESTVWLAFTEMTFVHIHDDSPSVVVSIDHEPDQPTKWTSLTVSSFQIDRGHAWTRNDVPFTFSDFVDKLTSRAIRWIPCTL